MYERILREFRRRVKDRRYVMTTHADEEMWADDLTIEDIENAILKGRIVERQRDAQRNEWKYVVRVRSSSREGVVVVGKLGPTDEFVIITVFVD